jgi:hypothetical protein
MTESLKKEIQKLMFRINPLRFNYSVDRLTCKIGMYNILKKYEVSEEFLRHYIENGYISGPNWWPVYRQKLSEQFMRDFRDRVDWMSISICQDLTESFMREMKDDVLWNYAAENQKMSKDFIIEFHDRINYYCLIKNKHKDMKKLSELLIYELSLVIDKNLFEDTFIKNRKITYEKLSAIQVDNTYENRFELLDL